MPCLLSEPKVAYFPVTKCACTTIKLAWYQMENGVRFESYKINGISKHIHNLYPTPVFSNDYRTLYKDHVRIAIIRDPLKRLLSAYANRVCRYKELGDRTEARKPAGFFALPVEPDIDVFANYLARYIRSSAPIDHHTAPFSRFLGKDLGFYDHLLKMEDFDAVKKTFESLCGPMVFLKTQKSPVKIEVEELKPKTKQRLLQFLKPDYELLKKFYSPPC
jgi:hypothetical protein